MTTELDPARFTHETRRALDAACILVDALDPGLNMRPEPDRLVILDTHGVELASIPLHRLATIDYDLIWPRVQAALDSMATDLADQFRAAMRDGSTVVRDNPAGEEVRVDIGGVPFLLFHRSVLVESWPDPADTDTEPTDDPDDDDDDPSRPW